MELEREECQLADIIICPSDFVAVEFAALGVPPEKIQIVPYGVEVADFAVSRSPWDGRRPLRLLFAGGVTLRKGVQYLHQALALLNGRQVEARFLGPISLSPDAQGHLRKVAELSGQVPRSEVMRHYGWADLFVFPSICEGSATVTYEAMAAGLPVITTPNAGSVVRDDIDGFIVPIRDSEAIAEKIEVLARNPELLAWMCKNARQRAEEFNWERYEKRLVDTMKKCIH